MKNVPLEENIIILNLIIKGDKTASNCCFFDVFLPYLEVFAVPGWLFINEAQISSFATVWKILSMQVHTEFIVQMRFGESHASKWIFLMCTIFVDW